ncbi:response regulator transcription factor [Bifidobacterium simiarum]|uniref:response regulator transcription factor n=1 Tax=Bifidobacterium simiarum TaxID=2045441 RepID=UPI001BDBD1BF|nr:response regulator transcription factor [Bifidobacterium simiarum]MBT1165229.1 response regulator transcription factor [Bifidobacterium simiarum]
MQERENPERLLLPAVMLIEDDPNLGSMMQEMLDVNYRVEWAQTRAQAETLIRRQEHGGYDALIVDRRLPDGDGLDLVRSLRRAGITVPALMLTALSSVDDIVEGLDSGANDYLTKPFHITELEARLRALLRGYRAQSASVIIGDWLLKTDAMLIEDPDGRQTPLTDTETHMLALLASSPDHVFARDELLGRVFSEGSDQGVVDVYVSMIRSKTTKAIIDTVRGRGYRIGRPEAE